MRVSRETLEAIERLAAAGRVTEGGKPVGPMLAAPALPDAGPVFEDEEAFVAAIIAEAKRQGWKAYHTRISWKSEPDFPDLVLVKHKVLVIEAKTEAGVATAGQLAWLDAFRAAGVDARLC